MVEVVGTAPTSAMVIKKFIYRHSWKTNNNTIREYTINTSLNMKTRKSKIQNLVYIIVIVFLLIYFKFFQNTYIILKSSYENRLVSNYGYCERNSYGFIKYIEKNYKLEKNIKIINDEMFPRSDGFIYKPKKDYYKNRIILLNYNEKNSLIDLNKYKILEKFKNCFYLKLK